MVVLRLVGLSLRSSGRPPRSAWPFMTRLFGSPRIGPREALQHKFDYRTFYAGKFWTFHGPSARRVSAARSIGVGRKSTSSESNDKVLSESVDRTLLFELCDIESAGLRDEPGWAPQDHDLDRPLARIESPTEADPDEEIRLQVLGLQLLEGMWARGFDLDPPFLSLIVLDQDVTCRAAVSCRPSRTRRSAGPRR